MTDQTILHIQIRDHITHASGKSKTVCVSTCLSFFGINPNQYNYTNSWESILRRYGYSVRSRMTDFKIKKFGNTMTQLRRNMKKSKYGEKDYFIVWGTQMKVSHLMVLNGNGETVIDTAKGSKWKVIKVVQVFK